MHRVSSSRTRSCHSSVSQTKATEAKKKAGSLAFGASVIITILKCFAAYWSGSLSVLSEALHSSADCAGAFVTFLCVRNSHAPADREHPYGRGKLEHLAAMFEAALLLWAGGYILFDAAQRGGAASDHHSVSWVSNGIVALCAGLSFLLYAVNSRVAVQSDSQALRANASHFFVDGLTSSAIFFSLLMQCLTGWTFIDSFVGCGVALFIIVLGWQQGKEATLNLLDNSLPEHEQQKIRDIVFQHQDRFLELHDLRTRKSGQTRFIDFHLVVCGLESVHASHGLCDTVEEALYGEFPRMSAQIHVEPCAHIHFACQEKCPRKAQKHHS